MTIGFLSDAHGNYIGLKACLDYLQEHAERIFFLGDAVGYFPFPNEVIDRLRSSNVECISGNHDAMLVGKAVYESSNDAIYKMTVTRNKISLTNYSFLENLPTHRILTIDNKKILMVHGSPADELTGYVYIDTDITSFVDMDYDVIITGHTHRSFIKEQGGKIFINTGSCGFSRDNGNKLTVALYDSVNHNAKLKHFLIDKKAIMETFLPYIHPTVVNVLNRNNIYEA